MMRPAQRVIGAYGDRVVMENALDETIAALFKEAGPMASPAGGSADARARRSRTLWSRHRAPEGRRLERLRLRTRCTQIAARRAWCRPPRGSKVTFFWQAKVPFAAMRGPSSAAPLGELASVRAASFAT